MPKSFPKPGTGIKASLVQPYDYTVDVDWAGSSPYANENADKYHYLTQFAVQVGEDYFIRHKTTGTWEPIKARDTARRVLTQQRAGQVRHKGKPLTVTGDDVKAFLAAGIVHLAGTTYAPGAGDLVSFGARARLNTYVDRRMTGDTDHLEHVAEFLKMIRNSLCAAPDELDLPEMLDEIRERRDTPFAWVMHWLAARYQMPGFAPMTNLWFIGRRGTGKGTLVSAMRQVLGAGAVGKAERSEVEKGWTNFFLGHELIEWDEFKSSKGWRELGTIIKEKTGNEVFSVTERNKGSAQHPACAMHIFSTNEERPILVEHDDRQNTMIGTVEPGQGYEEWFDRAKKIWSAETGEFNNPFMVSGFAALLNLIEVDVAFVRTPRETPKRLALKGQSADSVKKWIEEEGRNICERGKKFFLWDAFYDEYKSWTRENTHVQPEDLDGFKSKMKAHGYGKDEPRKVAGPYGERSARVCVLTLPANVVGTATAKTPNLRLVKTGLPAPIPASW